MEHSSIPSSAAEPRLGHHRNWASVAGTLGGRVSRKLFETEDPHASTTGLQVIEKPEEGEELLP
jgi:hypothetical protein